MVRGCPKSREVEMGKVIVIKIKTIGAPVVKEEKKGGGEAIPRLKHM